MNAFLSEVIIDSSVGKESTCNAGDSSLTPGLGRSAGEGIGYPLLCSGLESSMDHTVHGHVYFGLPGGSDGKASASNAGDPVQSLGWEDPWRRKWQGTPAFLPGKSQSWRSLIGYSPQGHSQTQLSDFTFSFHFARLKVVISPLRIFT